MEPYVTHDGLEVREGRYIQDGPQTLYKVSSSAPGIVRLIVCLDDGELPGRTAVRSFAPEQVHGMSSPSGALCDRYEAMASAGSLSGRDLGLLASYADGPLIWDAADLFAIVCRLAERGLLEPARTDIGYGPEDRGAYQLTEAGRVVLASAGDVAQP